ncbi:MAG: hypothetical protein EBQ99_01630 [Planctomycetes bacterium]|nr:hypothetical protein [Planctomycetota bacterium]
MISRFRIAGAACAVSACLSASAALVGSFDVGSGAKTATLQFDFENGNTWLATVRWDGSLNGFQALQMITGGVPGGQLQFQSFSFGKFVTGIGVGSDWQYGEGDLWPVENWWHYWTAEPATDWTSSMIGAEDRVLQDGSRDAWVFGSSAAPAVIPGPGAAVLAGLWCARGRRRRSGSAIVST